MKKIRYEVRGNGDGEFDYFIVPTIFHGKPRYNPKNKKSALSYVKKMGAGWVVKITEERVK